jgi:hypothetical protein
VRFVNHLIVDMTYLMDEILRLLALIRDFEQLKRNSQQWESMPQVVSFEYLLIVHMKSFGVVNIQLLLGMRSPRFFR